MRIFDEEGRIILASETSFDRAKINSEFGDMTLGGYGRHGDLTLFDADIDEIDQHSMAAIHLNGGVADIRVGGNGRHGDLTLFRAESTEFDRHSMANIHLNGGAADIRAGGNGRNGDLLLFNHRAESFDDADEANIHLDGRRGNIQFAGRLQPKDGYTPNNYITHWSIDEGVTAVFEGEGLWGEVSYTHHSDVSGSRGRLRELWIYNQLLNRNSMVLCTVHAGASCGHSIGFQDREHSISRRQGWCIYLKLDRTLPPGTEVRILYWIVR